MSEDAAIMIAMIIGIAVFAYNFVFTFLRGTSKNQRFIEKAKELGNYTEGKHVKTKIYSGDLTSDNLQQRSDVYEVTYEYVVYGKVFQKTMCFQNPGVVGGDYPYEVIIYYDSRNPKKAVCPQEATRAEQQKNGCLITIAVTILSILIIYRLLIRLF